LACSRPRDHSIRPPPIFAHCPRRLPAEHASGSPDLPRSGTGTHLPLSGCVSVRPCRGERPFRRAGSVWM